MARHYHAPHCVAELPGGRICGHEMRPLAERDPRVEGLNNSTIWVFLCGYCGAVQALETSKLDKYLAAR